MATVLVMALALSASVVLGQSVVYVDDDAPNDPGPNTPVISDPLEDGW